MTNHSHKETQKIDFEEILSNAQKDFNTTFQHTPISPPTKLEIGASIVFILLMIPFFMNVSSYFNKIFVSVNHEIHKNIENQVKNMDIFDKDGNKISLYDKNGNKLP